MTTFCRARSQTRVEGVPGQRLPRTRSADYDGHRDVRRPRKGRRRMLRSDPEQKRAREVRHFILPAKKTVWDARGG